MQPNLHSDSRRQLIRLRFERTGNIALLLFVAAALFLTWYRLRFGVDFNDEAFYIAVSYRFALGDKPFIDDLSLASFGLLTLPFTKLYLWFQGNLDGIVLYMRHLYLGFVCGVAGVVYASLTLFVRRKIALLVALSCVVFAHFSLPTLSYNTLASGLLIMGLFSGLYIIEKEANSCYFLFTGLCLGLVIIAYPPLILAVVFYVAVIIPCLSHRRMHSVIACLSGILLVGIAVAPVLIQAGSERLSMCLQYANSLGSQGGGLHKLAKIAYNLVISLPQPAILIVLLFLIGITYYKRPLWCGFLLSMLPLALMPLWSFAPINSLKFINNYSLLAPLLAILAGQTKLVRHLFLGVWLPAFVAGVITAWSSGNGAPNASIGWFAGSLVSAVLMALVLNELDQREKAERQFRLVRLQWLPIFALVLFLLVRSGVVYGDDLIPALTSRVASGPYRGMYTTATRYRYLQTVTRDVNQLAGAEQTILFYDMFPAGYLLSPARPSTPTIWMQPVSLSPKIKRNLIVHYYQHHAAPDIIVQMFQYSQGDATSTRLLTYPADDVFNNYIHAENYQLVLKRKQYKVMRKLKFSH